MDPKFKVFMYLSMWYNFNNSVNANFLPNLVTMDENEWGNATPHLLLPSYLVTFLENCQVYSVQNKSTYVRQVLTCPIYQCALPFYSIYPDHSSPDRTGPGSHSSWGCA